MTDAFDCPTAVRDFLAASLDIAEVVGSRIYADAAPQGEHGDRIIISHLGATPEYSLSGEINRSMTRLQLDFWSEGKEGYGQAKVAGELIRKRLSGYRGMLNETVECFSARFIRGPEILASPPTDGSPIHRRRSSMDVELVHSVSVPDFT